MRGQDALKEKIQKTKNKLFGSAVCPKEFEAHLA